MPIYTAVTTSRSHLLRSRLARFRRTLDGLERGEPRALHGARVASRRLRELLPLLSSDRVRKLRRRLRAVTAGLGAVREFDALLPLIDEHLTASRTNPLDGLRVSVTMARDEARARLVERLPPADIRRLARKLARLVDEAAALDASTPRTGVRGWRWALDARVARRAAQLTDAIAKAGAVYLPERLHRVRIAVKKLRYAVELAAEAGRPSMGAALRALKRSQDVLGRMHDLQRLIERTHAQQASLTPPQLSVWRSCDALATSLEDECRRLHARYVRASAGLTALAEALTARPAGSERGRTGVGQQSAPRARVK
jgi:CHAD domain-containing protein